jgi:hypothetical protein
MAASMPRSKVASRAGDAHDYRELCYEAATLHSATESADKALIDKPEADYMDDYG